MIEPIWLKKTVTVNGFPKEVEVSNMDIAIKLNELIAAYNEHTHYAELTITTPPRDTTKEATDVTK